MASSRKKHLHPLLLILLAVVLVFALAVGIVCAVLNNKVSSLQQGAAFTLRYEITPNSAQTPPLLNILERVNAAQGGVSGQYAPGKLQLSFYQLDEDGSVDTSPFTRAYIDSEETLFDAGQLYGLLRQSVAEKLPIAGSVLPEWGLGDYISQTQLAAVLGVGTDSVELQELSGFTLSLRGLKKVTPSGARKDYLYLQLPAREDGTTLVLGFEKDSLFSKTTPVHVLLTIPEHNVHIQLTGTVTAQKTVVVAPASRMQDSDVDTLVQLRQTFESVMKMVQAATK